MLLSLLKVDQKAKEKFWLLPEGIQLDPKVLITVEGALNDRLIGNLHTLGLLFLLNTFQEIRVYVLPDRKLTG